MWICCTSILQSRACASFNVFIPGCVQHSIAQIRICFQNSRRAHKGVFLLRFFSTCGVVQHSICFTCACLSDLDLSKFGFVRIKDTPACPTWRVSEHVRRKHNTQRAEICRARSREQHKHGPAEQLKTATLCSKLAFDVVLIHLKPNEHKC